jgi:hypothetical protein
MTVTAAVLLGLAMLIVAVTGAGSHARPIEVVPYSTSATLSPTATFTITP